MMQIDVLKRSVRLSVGELANFRNAPRTEGGTGGRWRAKVGQDWHKASAEQTRQQYPAARFEESIEGMLHHRDWSVEIQGRIDQVIPEGSGLNLREVKTVRMPLPCSTEELYERYPEYFAQAAIYLRLARYLPNYRDHSLSAELFFIGIEDGAAQRVELEQRDETLVERQLDRLIRFVDERRNSRVRLNGVTVLPAFEKLREGQAELIVQIEKASARSKIVLVQAPTGFGKTGIVLEHALKQMQNGIFDRCIFLTSKSTGQLETVRQLRKMIGDGLRFIQMRNRTEHRIESGEHICTGDRRCDDEFEKYWTRAGLDPPTLFEAGTVLLEDAKELGRRTGVCPYTLTKSCLPYAEIWIGDSNYLFAPASRHVFNEPIGFDPGKTLLIVDEAHNLPSRNADALSIDLKASDLFFAIEALRDAGAGRHLIRALSELGERIDALPSGTTLHTDLIYTLSDLADEIKRLLEETGFDYEAVAPFVIDTVWRIPELADRFVRAGPDWLYWCPRPGVLTANCLDASSWTAECLQPFSSVILMSATLDPIGNFCEAIGLPEQNCAPTIGYASWREKAYEVAIDCRVDTRMRERAKHYETTARTIAALIEGSPGMPIVLFFPSYQYGENVNAYLDALGANFRISVQPRGLDLKGQEEFIDQALLMSDAISLIVGSSFAEGIDKLGGRTETVMVVSPCLPEVNLLQSAKMDAASGRSREAAFEQVYIIPAMHRIHQALGRIVRAPGQKARVLLHGKRFNEPAYRKHLSLEFKTDQIFYSDDSFHSWLE
jgi:Rad3-related DNA helicase